MSAWKREIGTYGTPRHDYIVDGDVTICSRTFIGDEAEHERIMGLLLHAEENNNLIGQCVETLEAQNETLTEYGIELRKAYLVQDRLLAFCVVLLLAVITLLYFLIF